MQRHSADLPSPRHTPDAEQWNRELSFAAKLQRLLSTGQTAVADGLSASAASMSHYVVGGDYFDLLPLPSGGARVIMADVMGKGFGPAMIMTMVRAACRIANDHYAGPGLLLNRMNDLLYDDLQALESFVTMICVDYNPETRMLTMASAGHPYPLLLRQSAEVGELIKVRGVSVGMLPNRQYVERSVSLDQGDRLVIYTDGAMEVRDPAGTELTPAGLERLMRMSKPDKGIEWVHATLRAILHYAGESGVRDDVTVAVLEGEPPSGVQR